MNGTSRPELDELLGAYALDAIEPVERFEMDRYVNQNDDARREVDDLRETAAMLALLHVQSEPVPERIWDGIQSAIRETHDGTARAAEVIPLHGDDEDGTASRRRWAVPLPVAALLAAAASVAIVLLAARHDNSGRSVASAMNAAIAHGAHEVAIVGTQGTLAHVVQTSDGNGYLRTDHMPALPQGKVYQLWVVAQGQSSPISAGVLGRRPHPYASFVFQGHAQAYAVSVENAPGAVTPSAPIGEGKA